MAHQNALDRAIDVCGTQAELARRVSDALGEGVAPQHVWNWRHRAGGKVPAEYCRAVEAATGVTRYELRPDVFGAAPLDERCPTETR